MNNAFELIKATRGIELANFCFSGLDSSTRVENKRILLDENKRRLLVEAFIEFIDITFSDEIYDKLINQIEEKIELELNKKDNLPKKFIVPSEGIYYVDTDFEYLDSPGSLIIDFNWLALIIKPMIDYLQTDNLVFTSSTDLSISTKNVELFCLLIHCTNELILKLYRKQVQKRYPLMDNLDDVISNLKIGLYFQDPNFWMLKSNAGSIFFTLYQECCLSFNFIIVREDSPKKINVYIEKIAKTLNIKTENYSFINLLNEDQLLSQNKDDTIVLKLWLAIKKEFELDDLKAAALYLDLISIKEVIYQFMTKRLLKGVPNKEQEKMANNIFFELIDMEYDLISKEYKKLLYQLNNYPDDWREKNFKLKNMKFAASLLSEDNSLMDICNDLEKELNDYNFIKYDCNLFSFGKYLEDTIKIPEEFKKYFNDPESKDKDSKLIEEAIKNFDRLYRNRIIGQDHIIEPLWSSLKKWYIGIRSKKPVGSFLLCGPTGVGKTETAKFLSEELGTFDNLITLDMSEYQSEIDKTKIIGVAPGYAGYEQGAGILDKVAANPRSVILFDEIEKAHPLIFDLLLQLLDEGRLTDHKGNEVSFKECLIICTTNAHYGDIEHLGSNTRSKIINILSLSFRKEFLSRFTDILKFNNLTSEVMESIFDKKLSEEIKNISDSSQFEIIIIEDENYYQKKTKLVGSMDHSLGARELGRLINEEIIAPLIELIIDLGSELEGKKFYFDTLGTLKYK